MEIEGMENKEFVVTITWTLDAEHLLSEGTEDALEYLRGTGSADISQIVLRDKGAR